MHGLLDHLPTESDLADALRAWRKPAQQAATQFAQSALVVARLGAGQQPPALITDAVRAVLIEALPCLKSAKQGGSIEGSLLYRRYVQGQSIAEIAHADSIAPATLNRRVQIELAELSVVLAQMTVRLPQVPLPTRTVLIDSTLPAAEGIIARVELMQRARQILGGSGIDPVLALTGIPGSGKTTLAIALAHDDAIRQRYPDGVLWAAVGLDHGVHDCLVH
jgi:hypothetical protein